MTRRRNAALAGLLLIISTTGATAPPAKFALVELFTSEGCSSCPPADALLARLSADAASSGSPVATLAFHVTYWNKGGWNDRFSNETYTGRQRGYAEKFELESLYTPQMVIDGKSQFVGANAKDVEHAVHDALALTRATSVAVAAKFEGDTVTATCRVLSAPKDGVLWVAWADAAGESAPTAGENQGHKLHHVNVVRALQRVAIKGGAYDGAVHLALPAARPGTVVAWVQRGDAGEVVGGATSLIGSVH
jgi:hypothetical protein